MITGTKKEIINFLIDAPDDKRYELKEHRAKRSLNANSYFHVLVGKLAETLHTSNTEIKNTMLCRYGQYMKDDNGNIVTVTLKADLPFQQLIEIMHLQFAHTNGEWTGYRVIRGSHTYNTKEMTRLIDGLVSECKDVGIETMTPEELEKLKGYEKTAQHYNR